MGVADNKTYKDQYHFTDDFRVTGEEYPSINDEKRINSTIKENPYRSNVEIEGGEVILKPDLTALFKAQGKKHKSGGMDVLLAPDSFVFSDFKGIKITDDDKKLFELKKGGVTPAQVLKENIKAKHYNTLISNLDNTYKDDLSKKSSSMMLEKYISTLGNIAFLQESKKNFPDGLPSFSVGTAPIMDAGLDLKRSESKQYAKMGGPILQKGGYKNPDTGTTYDDMQLVTRYQEYLAKYGYEEGRKRFDKDFRDGTKHLGIPSDSTPSTYDLNNPLKQPPFTGTLRPPVQAAPPYDWTNPIHQPAPMAPPSATNPYVDASGSTAPPAAAPAISPVTGRVPRTAGAPQQRRQPTGSVPAGFQPPYTPPMPAGYGTEPLLVEKINQYNAINESSYPTDRKGLLQSRTEFANVYPELVEYMFKKQGMKVPNSLAGKNKKEYTREDLQQAFIDPNFAKPGEGLWGNRFGTNEIKEFTSQADFDNFIKGRNVASSGVDEEGNTTTVYDDPANPGQFYTPFLNLQDQPDTPNDFSYDPPAAPPAATPDPTVNPVTGVPQQGLRADWEFTPWQKISQGYNFLNYAGIQRHMPFRSRYNATYADPALVNEQQAVGNARGIAYNQMQAANTLNPILRNAQGQATAGELLAQIPGLGLQAETTNASIKNQFRQYNNQIKNNESMVNMANDQQYYQQAVEGRKNFSNARTYAANNAMNNVLRDVETNQKLSYNLLTQNNPAYGYDWTTGQFTRNKKSIMDAASDVKGDMLSSYIEQQGKDWNKMTVKERNDFLRILTAKGFQPSQSQVPPNFFGGAKKGGRVKNPYKY